MQLTVTLIHRGLCSSLIPINVTYIKVLSKVDLRNASFTNHCVYFSVTNPNTAK